MKHRPIQTRRYYHDRMKRMLETFPETKLVENKYLAIKIMLQKKYPEIIDSCGKDKMNDFLKDVVYVDRRLREYTQESQQDVKKKLATNYLVEKNTFI